MGPERIFNLAKTSRTTKPINVLLSIFHDLESDLVTCSEDKCAKIFWLAFGQLSRRGRVAEEGISSS